MLEEAWSYNQLSALVGNKSDWFTNSSKPEMLHFQRCESFQQAVHSTFGLRRTDSVTGALQHCSLLPDRDAHCFVSKQDVFVTFILAFALPSFQFVHPHQEYIQTSWVTLVLRDAGGTTGFFILTCMSDLYPCLEAKIRHVMHHVFRSQSHDRHELHICKGQKKLAPHSGNVFAVTNAQTRLRGSE